MVRLLSPSSLFPYTTLFRSALKDVDSETRQLAAWALGEIGNADAVDPLAAALKDRDAEVRVAAARGSTDRKSTRLNSSHRCISYAVFCLKKKTNTQKNTPCN